EDLMDQPAVEGGYFSASLNLCATGLPCTLTMVERLNLAVSVQLLCAVLAIIHAAPPLKVAKANLNKPVRETHLLPSRTRLPCRADVTLSPLTAGGLRSAFVV